MTKKIVYPIVPSRLSMEVWDKILDFIRSKGYVPFDHRRGASFEDFEEKLGRKKTLCFLINIMKQCAVAWIFGISEGTMGEFQVALEMKNTGGNIEILGSYGFDPEWDKYYEELKPKYGDLIRDLRGPRRLIAIVGPRAVGKTFWIDYLIERSPGHLRRIKNTTTRRPRGEKDHLTYNFLTVKEFKKRIEENKFLEYDKYKGNFYGSSLESIGEVLTQQDGIFAVTPLGAERLYEERFRINLRIVLLCAEEPVMRRNFVSRGITDKEEQDGLLLESSQFVLPKNISHEVVNLTGDTKADYDQIILAIFFKG